MVAKPKGMIEADSARHARQLLRGKEIYPVHIEARMNTSSGDVQRRRHAHRRGWRRQILRCSRANWQRWYRQQCRWKPALQAVSEQSEKLHVKSLGNGAAQPDSGRLHPVGQPARTSPASLILCLFDGCCRRKSGHPDVVLNRPGRLPEQRQRLKSRLLQAMLHPLVLLVVATGVVTILADGSGAENHRTV